MTDPLSLLKEFSRSPKWESFLVSTYYDAIGESARDRVKGYTIYPTVPKDVHGEILLKPSLVVNDMGKVLAFLIRHYVAVLSSELEDLPRDLPTARLCTQKLIAFRLENGI
jgi:hypothetical protein